MRKLFENKNVKLAYDIFMSLLAVLVAAILIHEFTSNPGEQDLKVYAIIDDVILIIFAIDYFTRLFLAKDKLKFFKSNIIELIAIIPFNAIFQALRITRLVRLLRLLKVLRLVSFLAILYKKMNVFFKTNNFHYILLITISTIIIGAVGISFAENMSYDNALWWAFVTTTTVGYGDISPATAEGRVIAVILMVIGIGFLGMLTGTISTFFIRKREGKTKLRTNVIDTIKSKLDGFDTLSNEDIDDICNILQSLKHGNNAKETNTQAAQKPSGADDRT